MSTEKNVIKNSPMLLDNLHEYIQQDPDKHSHAIQKQVINTHLTDIVNSVNYFISDDDSDERGLIVNGPAGGGKTSLVTKTLGKLNAKSHVITTSLTAPNLYIELYKHARKPGEILVIDDTDVMLENTEMCDILKAALGDGHVCYNKRSQNLRDEDVPREFICKGKVIMITNKHINNNALTTKETQRLQPVVDRCEYIYAGLDKRWTLVGMREMVKAGAIADLKDSGLDINVHLEFIDFIESLLDEVPHVSYRFIRKCLKAYKMDADNWRRHARRVIVKGV
jgi:transcriptional regulator CtsR